MFLHNQFFLVFHFWFQQLFSLQPTMGKSPHKERPGAPGAHGRKKPTMGKQAKKKQVTFGKDAKDYNGHNPVVKVFMMALLNFLVQRDQTPAQISDFVDDKFAKFALSPTVLRCITLLIKNMERAMKSWQSYIDEANSMVTLRNENPRAFKKVMDLINHNVRQPLLFPNGCRQGNERVPISERRLKLLRQVKKVVQERLTCSSGGGASAPPTA